MPIIPGYTLVEELYDGVKTTIYRAYREDDTLHATSGDSVLPPECDRQSVILKILKTEYPTPTTIAQFNHEYQVAKRLNTQGVIQPIALEVINKKTYVLVMEDFGGESLKHFITYNKLELSSFLKIAIQIVKTLAEIHNHNIIHKDIKTPNIIINPITQEVKITDFGISSLLSKENPTPQNSHELEGTLAYISPEQTGRMNRAIDYRTDLYSLGVTFYELLTGQLPFQASDAVELVHCHIAKQAIPVHQIDPTIPIAISAIVNKLLSKTAEDRYQSAYGLKWDLDYCLEQWEQHRQIECFPLAQHDIPNTFQIPQKLFCKMQEAIALGLEGLTLFGIHLTDQPMNTAILQEVSAIQVALRGRTIEDLYHLPVMTDPESIAIMMILISLAVPTYFSNINLWTLIIAKMVNLSLQHGNNNVSSFAYTAYGSLIGSAFGDYRAGYDFGQLGLRVNEKFNNVAFNSKIYFMIGAFINHWRMHVNEDIAYLKKAFAYGNETGDLSFSCYAANVIAAQLFIKGEPLEIVYRESKIFSGYVSQVQNTFSVYFHKILQQMILSLRGLTVSSASFSDDTFNEEQTLQTMREQELGMPLHFYYITKLQSLYLFGNYGAALQMATESENMIQTSFGLLSVAEHYFYYSLVLAARYPTATPEEKHHHWELLLQHQTTFKLWSDNCAANFLHKYLLISAEIARLSGQVLEAMDLYDRAIAAAEEQEFIQHEALANELAAQFYLAQGKQKIAKTYMMDARYGYIKWGATAKVNDLNQAYPQLFSRASVGTQARFEDTRIVTSTTAQDSLVLDLTSVLKASQTLSQEILLGQLLQKMMKILIENAGAQRGVLLLENKGHLYVEAQGTADQGDIVVLQSIPLENSTELPISLISYVERTRDSIVLSDATKNEQFITDSYITNQQPISILCAPILNQGKLIGVLYLENNLTPGVFTCDRLEILQILSSQSAISIENARLYSTLEESLQAQIQVTQAYGRFVPHEFLQLLGKESIIDVELGDHRQLEMSVMFADICNFTGLSEQMSPEENFRFINSYLSRMESVITENDGFIDKYIGDSIMALFSGKVEDAINAAIAMFRKLTEYNQHRANIGHPPIQIGIGINTGSLMLGTVGGLNRMDSTVISDAVNLAARIEKLTREYGVTLLISHQTFSRLNHPEHYAIRMIDQVKVKGKSEQVTVYEVFDADVPEVRGGKLATAEYFAQALSLYNQKRYRESTKLFQSCVHQNPQDRVARIYLERCLRSGLDIIQGL